MFIKKQINRGRYRRSLARMKEIGGRTVEAQMAARSSGRPEDLDTANGLVYKFGVEQTRARRLGMSIGKTFDELTTDLRRVDEQINSEHPDPMLPRY